MHLFVPCDRVNVKRFKFEVQIDDKGVIVGVFGVIAL